MTLKPEGLAPTSFGPSKNKKTFLTLNKLGRCIFFTTERANLWRAGIKVIPVLQ
jgi:hypothetical protein